MLKANTPYIIVSVVTPETDDPATSGKVVNYPCAPTISHDVIELTEEGQYLVRAAYAQRGYIAVLDLLKSEKDRDPLSGLTGAEKAERHRDYHARAQAGQRVGPYPREWLPREAIRRQACGETDPVQALADANKTAPPTAKLAQGRARE